MDKAVIAARLTAQQLSGPPARAPEDIAERLIAIQAQDARATRLAVRSRSVGLRARDVDEALTDRRSLVITWLNRGMLHLVRPADYWWMHPLTTPQIATSNLRRLLQEGVSDAQARRGVQVVIDAVRSHGPQTRSELRRRLVAAHVPVAGQALVHVLFAATLRGEIVRGPLRGSEHAFVAVEDWLGEPPEPLDRPAALSRLARRYLRGHGPADAGDLARWAGLTLGDARRALDGVRDLLVERPDGLVDLADRERAAPLPKPRLLGPFDPLLLGWASRAPFVGIHHVVTSNGIIHACILVGGRVVGTWRLNGPTLSLKPLENFAPATARAVQKDAGDVLRFLDRTGEREIVFEA